MKPAVDHVQPAFLTLPAVDGMPDLRWVSTTMMDAEEYHAEGWHIVDRYTTDTGREIDCWRAEMPGCRAYGRLLAGRRNEAKARAKDRGDADAGWREYVDATADARPGGYR